ncbi:hypothetical protein [Aurantimonas coralicida]|uniref:hypothetical protein n=1 Tax=Aurantimonas coralicida TaxID=182270 RepID=UPI001E53389E|nr:hypothetical protein [Aurantimonas coralicida]MCD1645194.1 hypothetical protein [Aurantimonas coralicida]
MPGANIPLSADEIAAILADYAAGMSQGQIAEKTGRCRATVHLYVSKAGMTRRPQGLAESTPELVERFAKLRNEGHTRARAARIVNSEAGTSYDASTYRDAMMKMGLAYEPSQAAPARSAKTEVIFHDLAIRVVPSTEYEHVGESAFAPVSLSAGVRVLEVAA